MFVQMLQESTQCDVGSDVTREARNVIMVQMLQLARLVMLVLNVAAVSQSLATDIKIPNY
jgi:hypothetical protein